MLIKLQQYGFYYLPFKEHDRLNLERCCRVSMINVNDFNFYAEIAAKMGYIFRIVARSANN